MPKLEPYVHHSLLTAYDTLIPIPVRSDDWDGRGYTNYGMAARW